MRPLALVLDIGNGDPLPVGVGAAAIRRWVVVIAAQKDKRPRDGRSKNLYEKIRNTV
jgi:hypothetical protein